MVAHRSDPNHPGNVSRYVVRSSDVISDLRVNISEEGSENVIWYKERFLSDDEIVEHFVENATSTIMWTIHRPKRGWYIHLRTPSFPPGVFIPLLPVPKTALYHAEAALSFTCRTTLTIRTHELPDALSPPSSSRTSSETVSTDTTAVHSYPPSPPPAPPPPLVIHPPSPASVDTKLNEQSSGLRRQPRSQTQLSQFVLSPYRQPEPPAETATFFSRALSIFRSHRPSHSYSFTLAPVDAYPNEPNPSPIQSQSTQSLTAQPQTSTLTPVETPLLSFHDHTPLLTVRSLTGLMEIDEVQVKALGVESTFWIAMALTYLQFLEERESYLAASAD